MKRIALILGALVLFTNASSCQKAEKDNNQQEKRLYRFEAGLPETKVYFGEVADGHYPLYWKEGDEVRMFSNSAQGDAVIDYGDIPVVPSADGKTASFTLESSLPAGNLLYAVSPASALVSIIDGKMGITMPTEQTPEVASPDPRCIVILAITKIPSESTAPIQLKFQHAPAYGRLSLEGLTDTPKKVYLFFEADSGQSLTLNTSSTKDIFFAWKSAKLGGTNLKVSVLTEKGAITRTVTLPETASFKTGVVSRFTVDMSSAGPKMPVFDEENIVFSFGAISDTHINSATNSYAQKLTSALTQFQAKASEKDPDGLDAVVVAGDLTDQPTSTATQIVYFKQLYEQVFDPTKVPMIYTVGNHDANPSYWWTANTVAQAKVMQTGLGDNYFLFDQDQDNRKNFECRDCLVGGYHVLSITPNANNPVDYDLNVKTWLDNRLKAITEAEPEKFVIVNTHPMIENTVYGSLLGTPMGIAQSDIWQSGDTWATRKLSEVLEKYPQVVTFSGHLHFPLNDPRSIWQASFTSFGCGSTRYMAIENGKYQDMKSATVMNDCEQFSQGWLIQMDRYGNMRATPMDFYNKAVIGKPYEVPYPQADKSHLTRFGANRITNNRAPFLPSLDVIEKTLGSSKTYTVEWAAGEDDQFVHHYVLTLKKGSDVVWTRKYLADFYLYPKPDQMKKTWTSGMGGLVSGEYEVNLVAYDSWNAESNTLKKTFTVDNTPVPVVTGVYADIDFTDSSLSDSKGKLTLTNKGATLGKASVSFDGSSYSVDALSCSASGYAIGQFKEIATSDEFKAFANAGFSVETFFVDKSPGSAVHGIVCGTQYGGWGLASRATGVPYFIVGEDAQSTYKNVDATSAASTTDLTHLVGVYDASGKKLKLYINGSLNKEATISGNYFPGTGDTFNRFCLGADISGTTTPDFPCINTVIVDAKIYTGALTDAEALKAYQDAVNELKMQANTNGYLVDDGSDLYD